MTAREVIWSDVSSEVFNRLCDCVSLKEDIVPLAKSVFNNKKGFDAEEALIYVLEHLECNSQYFDLTTEEFNDYMEQIGA